MYCTPKYLAWRIARFHYNSSNLALKNPIADRELATFYKDTYKLKRKEWTKKKKMFFWVSYNLIHATTSHVILSSNL
jgi:hypothetical protein